MHQLRAVYLPVRSGKRVEPVVYCSDDDEETEELTVLAAVTAEGIAKLLIAAARGRGGLEEGTAAQVLH